MSKKYENMKPSPRDEFYADHDEEYGHGVYGTESGFCYALVGKDEAERIASEMNASKKKAAAVGWKGKKS